MLNAHTYLAVDKAVETTVFRAFQQIMHGAVYRAVDWDRAVNWPTTLPVLRAVNLIWIANVKVPRSKVKRYIQKMTR